MDNTADNLKLQRLLFKIKNCTNYDTLYRLEEDFNAVGLTLQMTVKDKMVLCKIIDDKAVATKIFEDYIFVGAISESMFQLSDKLTNNIINFVMDNAAAAATVKNVPKSWQHGVRMYGQVIVVNEDIDNLSQFIVD